MYDVFPFYFSTNPISIGVIMYLHMYWCISLLFQQYIFTYVLVYFPANPIGIGVIYVLAPNIVGSEPTQQIPKLVNE